MLKFISCTESREDAKLFKRMSAQGSLFSVLDAYNKQNYLRKFVQQFLSGLWPVCHNWTVSHLNSLHVRLQAVVEKLIRKVVVLLRIIEFSRRIST